MKTTLSKARVGFLIFVGILAFSIGIFFVGEKSHLFSTVFYVNVNFPTAEGVKPGSMVVLSGYNVGTVTDIGLSTHADSVRLTMRISEEVHKFIRIDSRAEIKQEGLVGNKIINLQIGSPGSPEVRNRGYIIGVPAFALTGLVDNVTSITDSVKLITGQVYRLLRDIEEGRGTVGRLLRDDALYTELTRLTAETGDAVHVTSATLKRISGQLEAATRSLDSIAVTAASAARNADRLTGDAADLVRGMKEGRGTVGALLNDRALYDSLRTLTGALATTTYDAGTAADQLARSIYAMRQHWLFGRVFAGEDFEKETPPVSAYQQRLRDLERQMRALETREAELRAKEQQTGTPGGQGGR
jgi:phospholipid/cholesterol/gamma-HCH transport system substrate-binding protein